MARAVAFDMGGTSADVCLVQAGGEVDESSTIAGLPLPLPTVAVHTVGCGGGSIAYVDAGGALRVGPQSAGAVPGPACYGQGDQPTVTDAHLALGHLGPDTLLAGAFPIDVDAAVRAIERLGKRLSLSAAATARGILTIADVTMARAILVITAERAVDPARVPLVAYGGAGGLHAAGLMARLSLPSVLLPPHPGAFSALGLALAGESVERSRAVRMALDRAGEQRLTRLGRELTRAALAELPGRARSRVEVLLRFRGQGTGLRLRLGHHLAERFVAEHQHRYGFVANSPLEVVQVTARAETPPRRSPPTMLTQNRQEVRPPSQQRRAPIGGGSLPVFARADLGPRARVEGPAVIEEPTGTTLVPAGYRAWSSAFGLVMISAS